MTARPSAPEPRPRDRWRHGLVPVLGLIGEIGGGKSSLARRLAGRGAAVIDADAVGHELLEGPAIRERVVGRFGPGVLAAGRVDRRALGAIVFRDATARADLEAILHPEMRDEFRAAIGRVSREGVRPCIVLDAAILLEAGWDDLCDRVAFVTAPRPERLRRVAESRGWSDEALAARERSQWPAAEKRRRSDRIIDNEGSPARLDREADRLLEWLRAGAAPEPAADAPAHLREIA